jgi:hypothetical protein
MVEPERQSPLPQFMILVFENEVPESSSEVPPTFLEAHMKLPGQIAETGGRIVGGHAVRPASTGVSIEENQVTAESPMEGFAGYFIVEASDFDHAVWIGRMIPVLDGHVEVRPLVMA